MGAQSWYGPPLGEFKMDFTDGSLNIIPQIWKMNFGETNGVICDKNGNLLFSSNGIWVSNAQNDTMMNGGRGFNPGYYTTQRDSDGLFIPQANLIIPFPDDTNKYYLFHETCDDYGNTYCSLYLYYSIIDMTLDSGNGAVIEKNHVLLNDSLTDGRLTACKHANGRDWWLITHQWNTNKYFTWLITPSGINGPYIQNLGSAMSVWGQSVFSPDGKYFAYFNTLVSNGSFSGSLDIYDFNRCTGELTLKAQTILDTVSESGGVAFSPNSEILYASAFHYVYQFDMNASSIPASKITVATWDGFSSPVPPLNTYFYLSQLAPDGKIYINCPNSTIDIHVINNPNTLGLGCDVCQHCIHLPAINHFTIANHPNYFLGADSGSVCDSLPNLTQFITKEEGVIKIYPNPITDNQEVTFIYPSLGDKTFIIVNNADGKEVARYGLPQWSSVQHFKLPKLSTGIYVARFLNKKFQSSLKLIVE